jgi:hypothetical protein
MPQHLRELRFVGETPTAWRMAFARWSDWNFGERDGHSAPTEITLSNMDFAIVGYAVECLTPEERETHIAGCLDMVGRAEHVWHKSQLNSMHYYIEHCLALNHSFMRATAALTEITGFGAKAASTFSISSMIPTGGYDIACTSCRIVDRSNYHRMPNRSQ